MLHSSMFKIVANSRKKRLLHENTKIFPSKHAEVEKEKYFILLLVFVYSVLDTYFSFSFPYIKALCQHQQVSLLNKQSTSLLAPEEVKEVKNILRKLLKVKFFLECFCGE